MCVLCVCVWRVLIIPPESSSRFSLLFLIPFHSLVFHVFFIFLALAILPAGRAYLVSQPNKYDDEDGIKRVSFMRDDTSSIDDRIESPVNPRLSGSSLIQFTALDPVDAPVDRLSSSHLSSSFKTKTSSIKTDCCCTSGPLLLFPIMFST